MYVIYIISNKDSLLLKKVYECGSFLLNADTSIFITQLGIYFWEDIVYRRTEGRTTTTTTTTTANRATPFENQNQYVNCMTPSCVFCVSTTLGCRTRRRIDCRRWRAISRGVRSVVFISGTVVLTISMSTTSRLSSSMFSYELCVDTSGLKEKEKKIGLLFKFDLLSENWWRHTRWECIESSPAWSNPSRTLRLLPVFVVICDAEFLATVSWWIHQTPINNP